MEQVAWVKEQMKLAPAIPILIKGAPLTLMEELKGLVYFDQGGRLCRKPSLQYVPARIIQAGLQLQIEDISLPLPKSKEGL